VILAQTFGSRILGIEKAPEFTAVARGRVAGAGLIDSIEIVEADASVFSFEREAFDAALCLGATFVGDGLAGTLEALTPVVRPGGCVVVGEPFWRRRTLPDGVDHAGYVTLHETAARFEAAGLSLHWRALEDWLEGNGHDPDADEITYLARS
jgi:predicted O-methyltransferase YrrM